MVLRKKNELDEYRIKYQMNYLDTPQFLSFPEELQKYCIFPKELSYLSVLEFSKYFFNSSIKNSAEKKEILKIWFLKVLMFGV